MPDLDASEISTTVRRTVLMQALYDDLRRIAAGYMAGERPGNTLTPTALVHEAYLRLAVSEEIDWTSESQIRGFAATIMQRVLIDRARAKNAKKRGGDVVTTRDVEKRDVAEIPCDPRVEQLAEAIEQLSNFAPKQSQVAVLHGFGGQTYAEIAEKLGVTERTVGKYWRFARAWLATQLAND